MLDDDGTVAADVGRSSGPSVVSESDAVPPFVVVVVSAAAVVASLLYMLVVGRFPFVGNMVFVVRVAFGITIRYCPDSCSAINFCTTSRSQSIAPFINFRADIPNFSS